MDLVGFCEHPEREHRKRTCKAKSKRFDRLHWGHQQTHTDAFTILNHPAHNQPTHKRKDHPHRGMHQNPYIKWQSTQPILIPLLLIQDDGHNSPDKEKRENHKRDVIPDTRFRWITHAYKCTRSAYPDVCVYKKTPGLWWARPGVDTETSLEAGSQSLSVDCLFRR